MRPDMRPESVTPVLVRRIALPDSGWTVEHDGLAVDREAGRIYVLDELAPRVLILDAFGNEGPSIGREGEGPGEFVGPAALSVGRDGTLYVADPGRGILLRWDAAGAFAGQRRLPAPYWGPGLSADADRLVYVSSEPDSATGSVAEILVEATRGESLRQVVRFVQPWVQAELPCGTMPVPKVLAPSLVWAADSTRVAVAVWPEPIVNVYEDGTLRQSFHLDTRPQIVTREMAREAVTNGQLQFLIDVCGVTAAQVVEAVGHVERLGPVSRLAIDPRGRIWVAIRSESELPKTYVLDADDGLINVLDGPSFPVAFLSARLYLDVIERTWGSELRIWELPDFHGTAPDG